MAERVTRAVTRYSGQYDQLQLVLTTLDDAAVPEDVDLPAFGLHALKGDLAGMYSVRVNGNWRVIFAFEDEDVILVDYLDYH